ncbi:hypothetical protein PEC106568_37090 [Pectobacterium carotovorum subsp. carotovorum]|nr:hypothetical protein PEC106568_37090 [Pectobacterium carotovorum subsp. carotovorum]
MVDWDELECRVAREESRHQAGTIATQRVAKELNQQEQRDEHERGKRFDKSDLGADHGDMADTAALGAVDGKHSAGALAGLDIPDSGAAWRSVISGYVSNGSTD